MRDNRGARAGKGRRHRVTRPLLVIFLTIFVNLVGFGIIIPLLPFYAETFGASPLVDRPAVRGVLALPADRRAGARRLSDRYGRRPVLIFSLLGTVVSFVMLALAHSIAMLFLARIVDGLSGGNISTARAYVADVTEPKDRARAYGLIGAAFGLGFIFGPALSGVLAQVSYTAPIWAAAGITLVATAMAWFWLPETVHRAHGGHRHAVPQSAGDDAAARRCGRMLVIDFVYWFAFAIFQTTFALFVARRVSASTRRRPATSSRRSACSARSCRAAFIRPIVQPARRQADVHRSAWSVRPSAWSPRR